MSERIYHLRVADLQPHELLKSITMLPEAARRQAALAKSTRKNSQTHKDRASELDAEWQALVEDIKARGVLEPLKVVSGTPFVVDGRHRLAAAQEAGLERVPITFCEPEQAGEVALGSVCNRRHFTKGVLAYIAILMHPEVATEGQNRQAASRFGTGPALSAGPSDQAGQPSALSAEGLAKRIGASPRVVEQAAELYRLLQERPVLRAEMEASLFGGSSLNRVLSFVKGEDKTPGGAGNPVNHVAKSNEALGSLVRAAAHWAQFDANTQNKLIGKTREFLTGIPRETLLEILAEDSLQDALQQLRVLEP